MGEDVWGGYFLLHYCRRTGRGSDMGQVSCVQSRASADPCQAKRQQVDKSYSHMKTEWISRLNFFSRSSAYRPAELHCSTPAKHWLLHSSISLRCLKLEKSEIPARFTLVPHVLSREDGINQYLAGFNAEEKFLSLSCQTTYAGMLDWPSSISCQADLPAWEQATQLRVQIIKSTAYLMDALSFESLALTSQVQSSFRSKRIWLRPELISA